MAPARRQSNGRSPLVNQQSQITSFFTKKNTVNSSSPSPPIISNPNPNPNRGGSSPTTPSPLQSKKTLLIIGNAPITPVRVYGEEVVQRRIRVYWPLDKDWYEGVVMSYDGSSGRHLVRYDDAEEEMLDLGKERVEWVDVEERSGSRKFKRLRRGVKFEAEEVVAVEEGLEDSDGANVDNSSDEDWGKNVVEEEECVDLEDEEMVDGVAAKSRGKGLGKSDCKKRKGSPSDLGSGKKNKRSSVANNGRVKASSPETPKNWESGNKPYIIDHVTSGDASERFSMREAEKFHFLGVGRRDAKRRCPGDPDYDPKTLYLPPGFLNSLTGCQKQWWEFKSKHMDKVLFFKMGKFYELFEMDAHIGAKELDLQYMKGDQPHCGFPEKNFSMNVEKLARKGYRVLVVEQTETPDQLEIRRKEKGCKDKVVKREICAMVTKGTLTEGELLSANPEASYLMAINESQILAEQDVERMVGVCLVDVSTSRIILGQFKDDGERSTLCCILSELRPVEIIKPSKLLSPETEKVLATHSRNPLVNELIPDLEFWGVEKTIHEVKLIYKRLTDQLSSGTMKEVNVKHINSSEEDELGGLPEVLSELMHAGDNGSLAVSALGGTLYYLKQAFLDETLLRYASFELLPCYSLTSVVEKPYMVLDAAAFENLEIFENSRNGGSSGTLYAQLNHCITAFGKRLLKSWLARPLYHSESIKERQDAIACLHGDNLPSALEFRKALCRLPDMERLLARIFANSEANGRTANNVVLYEDAAKKQLQEFISALRGCELMDQACSLLGVILDNADAGLLHQLLTPGKALPGISSIIKHFKDAFDWGEACNLGRIIPHEGADENYDSACKKVKEIEAAFAKHLKEQQKILGGTSITFVTVGKDAYLLEIPEGLRGSVPREYELRSSKKGYFRYWTPTIKKLLGELSHAESEKESTLKCILQRLIGRFCQHHKKWRQLTSATAELDVLISLAIARDYYEGPTCRPVIIGSSSSTEVPCLTAKSLGHPALRNDSLGKGSFVPNNITVGGSDHASFILLTGPNMGGKSTLLRQVCLAVILAQIGADVPAESFELSPVDRIFVRMGAKDHIMAGQSTFLTELSETASMLSSATSNSLVALDELGRGTSTSDGQAIAESVLEHFVHKVQCRGMFSTHYHRLSVDYEKNLKVLLCHMACHVGKGVGGLEEVTFLYKLTPGACPKSYGVNVARIAGLPDSILQRAATKSREFESTFGNHVERSENNSYDRSSTNEMVVLIENLFQVAAKSSCHESPESNSIVSLNDLQSRARILLQQN